MSQTTHALSVDLEDEDCGLVLVVTGQVVSPTENVVRNSIRLLELFAEHGHAATWFVLGEVAEAFPSLIRRIADAGHEIGIHGFHHRRLHELSPEQFREAVSRAKKAAEDAAGMAVRGHRAAAMSLTAQTWWAIDVLTELGFVYDSSVFPFRRSALYGVSGAPVGPYTVAGRGGGVLLEIPLTVVPVGGLRLPVLGGGYLRHFPLWVSSWALRRLESMRRSANVYLHPYEIDADAEHRPLPAALTPSETATLRRVLRGQYRNRSKTMGKLRVLLGSHRFAPISEAFGAELDRFTTRDQPGSPRLASVESRGPRALS